MLLLGAAFTACDNDIETVTDMGQEVVAPPKYSELYYQNLREYKKTDHEIAFGWFSKYGPGNSMAIRFAGIPDSMDIVSLWGGIPKTALDMAEMRDCQQRKGMKFLLVDICRINKQDEQLPHRKHWLEILADTVMTAAEKDSAKHEVMKEMALHFVDMIFENDLDGFDIDFEPEGDPVQGALFYTLIDEAAKYLGPNPDITREERYALIEARYGKEMARKEGSCDKLLCVDAYGQDPGAAHCNPLINYFFSQDYNGIISRNGYPTEKVVHCMSIGEDWNNDPATTSRAVGNFYTKKGRLYDWARWEPATGKKGGFGGFIFNDDYNVTPLNPYPYARLRDCIQICNPAIY